MFNKHRLSREHSRPWCCHYVQTGSCNEPFEPHTLILAGSLSWPPLTMKCGTTRATAGRVSSVSAPISIVRYQHLIADGHPRITCTVSSLASVRWKQISTIYRLESLNERWAPGLAALALNVCRKCHVLLTVKDTLVAKCHSFTTRNVFIKNKTKSIDSRCLRLQIQSRRFWELNCWHSNFFTLSYMPTDNRFK